VRKFIHYLRGVLARTTKNYLVLLEKLHDLYSLSHVRKFKNKVKTLLLCSLYSDFDIYMAHV